MLSKTLIKVVVDRVIEELQQYARLRKKEVTRGVETPELAAILVSKYGDGAAMVVQIMCGYIGVHPPRDVHAEVDTLVDFLRKG